MLWLTQIEWNVYSHCVCTSCGMPGEMRAGGVGDGQCVSTSEEQWGGVPLGLRQCDSGRLGALKPNFQAINAGWLNCVTSNPMPNLATHIVVLTLPSPEVAISGLVLLSIVPLLSSYKKLTDRDADHLRSTCHSMLLNVTYCWIISHTLRYQGINI